MALNLNVFRFGQLVSRNKALMGKLLWRFPRKTNTLWHLVVKVDKVCVPSRKLTNSLENSLLVFLIFLNQLSTLMGKALESFFGKILGFMIIGFLGFFLFLEFETLISHVSRATLGILLF